MASTKSQVTKTAVLAKAVLGESKSQIAEDLGITRDTVRRILDESELATLVAEGKTGVYQLIGKSIKAFEHALDKHKTAEATVILRATGVLPQENTDNRNFSATVNLGVFPERA